MEAPLPDSLKMLIMDKYNGIGDLSNHLLTFDVVLLLHNVLDVIKSKAFPQTLKGPA